MSKIKIKRTVELSLTADDWALYNGSSFQFDREFAAEMMNRQIEAAINASSSFQAARAAVLRLLNIFSKYGAADTEGYAVATKILRQAYPGVEA